MLLDTGSTANVVSAKVARIVSLKPEKTSKVLTVATGGKFGATGKLSNITSLFDNLQSEVNFIVLQNITFAIIIGHQTYCWYT